MEDTILYNHRITTDQDAEFRINVMQQDMFLTDRYNTQSTTYAEVRFSVYYNNLMYFSGSLASRLRREHHLNPQEVVSRIYSSLHRVFARANESGSLRLIGDLSDGILHVSDKVSYDLDNYTYVNLRFYESILDDLGNIIHREDATLIDRIYREFAGMFSGKFEGLYRFNTLLV